MIKCGLKRLFLCDLSNPLLKGCQDMSFERPACGAEAKRNGEWEFKNKSYRADFRCPCCGGEFKGRIQFKLKYEGVVVKKTTARKEEEPAGENGGLRRRRLTDKKRAASKKFVRLR